LALLKGVILNDVDRDIVTDESIDDTKGIY
jgi:hypothetical protein